MDANGKIVRDVNQYMTENPGALYDEAKRSVFPQVQENLHGMISPRHFECAVTKTCQILTGYDYQGVFQPGSDYIVLESNYSNLNEVLETVKDQDKCREIAESCYAHVVLSGKYRYKRFVDAVILDIATYLCHKKYKENVENPVISDVIREECDRNNEAVKNEIIKMSV